MAEKMTVEKAKEMIGQGYHCSQCVMGHAAEILGLDKSMALKMSGGLGGGCYRGNVCGAVSAAIVALSMEYGFDQPKPYSTEQNELMISKVHEFENRFIEKNGSIVCFDLLGGNSVGKVEDAEKIIAEKKDQIREAGVTKNCPKFCADACEILDDMLKECSK